MVHYIKKEKALTAHCYPSKSIFVLYLIWIPILWIFLSNAESTGKTVIMTKSDLHVQDLKKYLCHL